jgi:hypothetical protein
LGDLFAKAIRPARVPARDTGDSVSSPVTAELAHQAGHQFLSVVNQPAIEFPLCPFQRCDVVRFGASVPGACGNPSDIVSSENHRPIHQRTEQSRFVPRSLRLSCAGAECGFAEFNEARKIWQRWSEAPGRQWPPRGFGISESATTLGPSSGRASHDGQMNNTGKLVETPCY